MSWREIAINKGPGFEPDVRGFQCEVQDGHLSVFVGTNPATGRKHLSISHRSNVIMNTLGKPAPGRYPTWDEIKEARYRFLPNEITVAQILPPREQYTNVHPTCFHLWEVDSNAIG